MTFDTGTWWLITIILTALLGCIGALVSRSIFKSLDEHSSDIKEVRENYTTRKDHKTDIDAVRREMKEVRSEMRTEIQTLSEDIKEVKETCLRKDVFEHNMLRLENKMDALTKFLMERRDAAEVFLRMVNLYRGTYYRLRNAGPILSDEEQIPRAELRAALDYLQESGYIAVRTVKDHTPAHISDLPLEDLECKLLPKGTQLIGGHIKDPLVKP